MQYDDLLDRDLEEGFSSSEEEEEEEWPATPPTRPSSGHRHRPYLCQRRGNRGAPGNGQAGARRDGLVEGGGGVEGPPPWRSHRRPRAREGPRPWPPRPDQGECKFATLKTYRTTQFNTVLYSLYADLSL